MQQKRDFTPTSWCVTKHVQNSNPFLGNGKNISDICANIVPISRNTIAKNLPILAAHPVTQYSGVPPPPRVETGKKDPKFEKRGSAFTTLTKPYIRVFSPLWAPLYLYAAIFVPPWVCCTC